MHGADLFGRFQLERCLIFFLEFLRFRSSDVSDKIGMMSKELFAVGNKIAMGFSTLSQVFSMCVCVFLTGKDLRERGINRIGNLLVPNDNYCTFEDWIMPILDAMLLEQQTQVRMRRLFSTM